VSVEHQPRPSESNERSQAELEQLAKERLEELSANPEAAAEHAEKRAEAAREVIHKQEQAPEPAAAQAEQDTGRPGFAARIDHALNYSQTMASIQRKLSPASRRFSRLIHQPVVEKTSEKLERTVMRPSIVAGATWSAAIVGLIFYITARTYGWTLSGSEMLMALLMGALLGLLIEGILRASRRRQ
jgi:hypothetical protein